MKLRIQIISYFPELRQGGEEGTVFLDGSVQDFSGLGEPKGCSDPFWRAPLGAFIPDLAITGFIQPLTHALRVFLPVLIQDGSTVWIGRCLTRNGFQDASSAFPEERKGPIKFSVDGRKRPSFNLKQSYRESGSASLPIGA